MWWYFYIRAFEGIFLKSKHVVEVYQAIWRCNIVWSPPTRLCNQQREAGHQLAALKFIFQRLRYILQAICGLLSRGQKTHRSALNSNECIGLSVPSARAPCFPSRSKLFTLKIQLRICAKASLLSWGALLSHIPAISLQLFFFLPFSEKTEFLAWN